MGRYWLIFSFGSDPPSLGSNSLQTKSLKISCWGSEDFWCLPSGWFLTRFHILYVKYGIYLFGQDFSKERNFITTREYFLKDRITVCLCPFLILHVNTLLLTQCFIYGKKKKNWPPFIFLCCLGMSHYNFVGVIIRTTYRKSESDVGKQRSSCCWNVDSWGEKETWHLLQPASPSELAAPPPRLPSCTSQITATIPTLPFSSPNGHTVFCSLALQSLYCINKYLVWGPWARNHRVPFVHAWTRPPFPSVF